MHQAWPPRLIPVFLLLRNTDLVYRETKWIEWSDSSYKQASKKSWAAVVVWVVGNDVLHTSLTSTFRFSKALLFSFLLPATFGALESLCFIACVSSLAPAIFYSSERLTGRCRFWDCKLLPWDCFWPSPLRSQWFRLGQHKWEGATDFWEGWCAETSRLRTSWLSQLVHLFQPAF